MRPKLPYQITPHFRAFTLKDIPTPALYENGSLRLIITGIPFEITVSGEPMNAFIRVFSLDRSEKTQKIASEFLRADFDYKEFLNALESYPPLRELASRFLGLRPTRCLSLYCALIDSVIKQRINMKMALRITGKLVRKHGERIELNGKLFYGYPPAERLSSIEPEELRKMSLTSMKARALVEIAKAEVEGRIPSIEDVEKDPWRVAEELTEIYGVGRWTAELSVAMVSKSFHVGPASDLSVRKGMAAILGVKPDEQAVRDALRELEEYAGLIMYLAGMVHESEKRRVKLI